MDNLFSVEGRVAIVTGASSGLGRRFAQVLHERGAHVVAAARRTAQLEALVAECPGVVPVTADMADGEQVQSIVAAALERFGRVDILVNNAGHGVTARALDESLDDFRYVLEVNLVGLFDLARTAAREMIERGGGSVINIASINGLVASTPFPSSAYCASKGAVINLTRELACQWARNGVRVNALAPGYFPSEITDTVIADEARAATSRATAPWDASAPSTSSTAPCSSSRATPPPTARAKCSSSTAAGPHADQRPRNTGGRFSTKALIASRVSSVLMHNAWLRASSSSACSIEVSKL